MNAPRTVVEVLARVDALQMGSFLLLGICALLIRRVQTIEARFWLVMGMILAVFLICIAGMIGVYPETVLAEPAHSSRLVYLNI